MAEAVDTTGELITGEQGIEVVALLMRRRAIYGYFGEHVAGKKALEVGFGDGFGTYRLSSVAREITGIEGSLSLIDQARARYARGNLFFIKGAPEKLPFPDGTFEAVLSSEVLEHVKDYTAFIREAHRVLKPGGTALFATPNRSTEVFGVNTHRYRDFSPRELTKALGKVFRIVELLGLVWKDEAAGGRKMNLLDFLRLRRLMPRAVIRPLYRLAGGADAAALHGRDGVVTEEDFAVSAEGMEDSLDLIAICKK